MTAEEGPDGEPCEALRPVDTFNPVLQRFYTCLTARAMAAGCPLPPLTPLVEKTVFPDKALFAKAKGAVDGFKAEFNLKVNVKAAAKKRKYWGDTGGGAGASAGGAGSGTGVGAGAGAGAAAAAAPAEEVEVAKPDVDAAARKRAKANRGGGGGGDGNLDLADLFSSGPVSAVGSADPISNFNAMLKRRDGDFIKPAVQGMRQQIERLLAEGSALFLGKAFDCLKVLREACVQNFEGEDFNSFLQKLKDSHDRTPFWAQVQAAKLSLIHDEESDEVTVTKAQSEEFLKVSDAPVVAAPAPAPAPAPAASLYDDME